MPASFSAISEAMRTPGETMTGFAQAMASTIAMPKLSKIDGATNIVAA